jgi:hypothetical protein
MHVEARQKLGLPGHARFGHAESAKWNIHVAKGPKEGVHVLELPFAWGTSGSAVAYHASKILRVPERLILALPHRGSR